MAVHEESYTTGSVDEAMLHPNEAKTGRHPLSSWKQSMYKKRDITEETKHKGSSSPKRSNYLPNRKTAARKRRRVRSLLPFHSTLPLSNTLPQATTCDEVTYISERRAKPPALHPGVLRGTVVNAASRHLTCASERYHDVTQPLLLLKVPSIYASSTCFGTLIIFFE